MPQIGEGFSNKKPNDSETSKKDTKFLNLNVGKLFASASARERKASEDALLARQEKEFKKAEMEKLWQAVIWPFVRDLYDIEEALGRSIIVRREERAEHCDVLLGRRQDIKGISGFCLTEPLNTINAISFKFDYKGNVTIKRHDSKTFRNNNLCYDTWNPVYTGLANKNVLSQHVENYLSRALSVAEIKMLSDGLKNNEQRQKNTDLSIGDIPVAIFAGPQPPTGL